MAYELLRQTGVNIAIRRRTYTRITRGAGNLDPSRARPIGRQDPTLVIAVPIIFCFYRYEYAFAVETTYFQMADKVSCTNTVFQHLIEHKPQIHLNLIT